MQWISVKKLLLPPWGLTEDRIYDLIKEGLVIYHEWGEPMEPIRFLEAGMELEILEALIAALEDDKVGNTTYGSFGGATGVSLSGLGNSSDYWRNFKLLIRRYGFSLDQHGWPIGLGRIKLLGQCGPAEPLTIPNVLKRSDHLRDLMSKWSDNPWKHIPLNQAEDKIEWSRILQGEVRLDEVKRLLESDHPLSTRERPIDIMGRIRRWQETIRLESAIQALGRQNQKSDISVAHESVNSNEEPSPTPEAEKKTQGKYSILTTEATRRLEEIAPAIKSFYSDLTDQVKEEHGNNAEGEDWLKEAKALISDEPTWNLDRRTGKPMITPEVIDKINFSKVAKVRQRFRLKGEMAQIILQMEEYGAVNRDALLEVLNRT